MPDGRSIGPADAIPTPRTLPPAVASASVTSVSTTAQIASASPSGVGSLAWCTSVPSASTRPAAILVPPMSSASVRSAISACGCCRADADRRDARSRARVRPSPRDGRPAIAGTRGAAAAARSGLRSSSRQGEAAGIAIAIGRDIGLGDVDIGRHADEQRTRQRVREQRRRHAADLQPATLSGSSSSSVGAPFGVNPRAAPRPRPPAPSPATGSASAATVDLRWCPGAAVRRQPRCPQLRLALVDLVHRYRRCRPTVAATLIAPPPSPLPNRAVDPHRRLGSAPTTRRARPTAAGRRRSPSRRCRAPQARRRSRRGPSTPMSPTG